MNPGMRSPYVFDNHSVFAHAHHDALAELFDQFSRARIDELVNLSGASCLEVGAGRGSIARWLADRVGPGGSVLATDIKPQHIPVHRRLRTLVHDITADPPPEGRYRLVHARLLLNHLPARREALAALVAAVEPGGVLVIEDFDPMATDRMVAAAPDPEAAALIRRFLAAQREVLSNHGGDSTWSMRAVAVVAEEGLTNAHSVSYGRSWRGGGAGCRLLAAGLAQLRVELIAAGLTEPELDAVRTVLDNPRLVLHGHRLVSTGAAKPGPRRGPS